MQGLVQGSCQTLEAFPFFCWSWKVKVTVCASSSAPSLLVCSWADWSHYHNRTARLSSMVHTYLIQCQPPSYPLSMIVWQREKDHQPVMRHVMSWCPCPMLMLGFMWRVSSRVCRHALTHNANVILPLVYSTLCIIMHLRGGHERLGMLCLMTVSCYLPISFGKTESHLESFKIYFKCWLWNATIFVSIHFPAGNIKVRYKVYGPAF